MKRPVGVTYESFPLRILLVCVVIAACGCGTKNVASVHGKVTLDGEPVAIGNIAFVPPSGSGSRAAASIEQGGYTIPASDKLAPGTYRVEVSWHKPTGRKIASADPGMMIDETREAVPAKYNTDSTLRAEIAGGEVVKDFALTSK